MEKIKHWAESLQIGDRCLATIRHKTDGNMNLIKAAAIITDNSIATQEVYVWVEQRKNPVKVPYNELTKIDNRKSI